MKILVVSPHADDETLGAGGYLLKQRALGNELYWLNVTNMKEEYGYTKEQCMIRRAEIENVAQAFGFKKSYDLQLRPAGLDQYNKDTLISKFGEVFCEVTPDIVLLPNKTDVHSDHGIVFETAYSCTKAFRYPFIKEVLSMQILSETEYALSDEGFIPNMYVNIEEYIDRKIEIAKIYKSEIKQFPFPRSEECIRALAIVNGGSSFCKAAEAFRIIRRIQ